MVKYISNNFIVKRLKIEENTILSHNEIIFKSGLNIILGNNGTGKTTILELINFLKFNKKKELSKRLKDLFLSFFNLSITYLINLNSSSEFTDELKLLIETKNSVNFSFTFSSQESKKRIETIKILYLNNRNIDNIIKEEKIPEHFSRNEQVLNAIYKVTQVDGNIILLDDIYYLFSTHATALNLFKYLSALSKKNQIIITSLPILMSEFLSYVEKHDSKLFTSLKQAQILFLGEMLQKNIFDYFQKEDISDFLREFQESIKNVRKILKLNVLDGETQKILNRIIYANIITIMETYLSDCFKKIVLKKKKYKLRLLNSISEFNQMKLTLSDAYDWLENVDKNIVEILQTISFHNLGKIKSMFDSVLKVNFPDNIGDIFRAIIIRHDIVHRNGKNKNGEEIEISKDNLSKLIKSVEDFTGNIEKQISKISN
ncbi:MAG: hypothetical protein V3V33_05370 [Candidatus Lokiarchaeia archaeon]